MIADASMQLIGWAATKATEAIVERVTRKAARKIRAGLTARVRQFAGKQVVR